MSLSAKHSLVAILLVKCYNLERKKKITQYLTGNELPYYKQGRS